MADCFFGLGSHHQVGERVFQERVPGAQGQAHAIIAGAGHFLQEDNPEELVSVINTFMHAGK